MTERGTDEDSPRDPSMMGDVTPAGKTTEDEAKTTAEKEEVPADEQPAPSGDEEAPAPPADNSKAPAAPEPATEGGAAPEAAKKQKPKREINPKFKDVQETGQWGSKISTRDILVAVVLVVLVVGGVLAGVLVAVLGDDDDENVVVERPPPTPTPTLSPDEELFHAFQAIDYSTVTYLYQQDMPHTVEEYEGLVDDPNETPQNRAMSWLLYEDAFNDAEQAGVRWALASLYYGWQGDNWVSAENWLSSEDACEWEHITCDPIDGAIQEMDLQSNNLVGTIPPEIALLNTTQSIWLRNNELTGPLPNEVFGSMPQLTILYLDNNQLSGTIALSIRDNEVLNSLFLQSNDITGEWPRLFCAFSSSVPAPIQNFGIDCEEVTCPQDGCCTAYNCYYDD